jgi:hypothetical protein
MNEILAWMSDIEPFARSSLQQTGYLLSDGSYDMFLKNIRASVSVYLADSVGGPSPRQAHDILRKLWKLVNEPDPPIGLIRGRVKSLKGPSKAWLLQRGSARWASLVGGVFSETIFDNWLQSAAPPELVEVIKALVSEGGMMVEGRKDRPPKRIFEPMIMGVIRGSGEGLSRGGRPKPSASDELVMHLAIDWTIATGEEPRNGRGDSEGFSGLVHRIFDILGIESSKNSYGTERSTGAEQALRRYWAAVHKNLSIQDAEKRKDPCPKSIVANGDVEPKG